ncbi:hypothetical protein Barb4_04060 [Bacteroidales bacterium Barb4]|nr:hypothetical protein Barb4_04060 [Bacteroidales bacterium Barb4]
MKKRYTDYELRRASMDGVLAKYKTLYGYDDERIAALLGISRKSYYSRRKTPNMWRVHELDALVKSLKIPPRELISALYDLG